MGKNSQATRKSNPLPTIVVDGNDNATSLKCMEKAT